MSMSINDHAPQDGAGGCMPVLAPGPMSTAEALRRLALQRDSQAWSAILHNHGVGILRVAQRITGDRSLCEDVCQETLLQIRAHARNFRPPANAGEADAAARGWVMCIAYRTAVSMLRCTNRRNQNEEQAQLEKRMRGAAENASDSLLTAEQMARVRDEVAGLPDLLRSAVCLHFYGEMTYPELSAALECSEKAARKRVERGVQRLRTRLACGTAAVGAGALAAALIGQSASSAAAASASTSLSIGQLAAWQALLNHPAAPLLAGVAKGTGVAIMTKYVVGAAAVLAFGLSTFQAVRINTLSQELSEAKQKAAALDGVQDRLDTLENKLAQNVADSAALKSSVQSRNNDLAQIEKKVTTLEQQPPSSGVFAYAMPTEGTAGGPPRMIIRGGAGIGGAPVVIAADKDAPYTAVEQAIRQTYPKAPPPTKDAVVKILGDGTVQYQSADGRVLQQFKDDRIARIAEKAMPGVGTAPVTPPQAATIAGDMFYRVDATGDVIATPLPGTANAAPKALPPAAGAPAPLHNYGDSVAQTLKELFFGGDAMLKPPAVEPPAYLPKPILPPARIAPAPETPPVAPTPAVKPPKLPKDDGTRREF
ncbi:MAG TPA: sigma-70 family RNA polymerase sigma factor [Planctomycetota bacterium]|nr:sigma-70 family RNA polymerase sigma factor [Planctomycetota bacterium]